MTRIKRGVTAHRKHKRELKRGEGHRGTRSKNLKRVREANLHAGDYARRDRRARKRQMRQLWVVRLNASARALGVPYRDLIAGMKKANIVIDRKMLSDLAIREPAAFAEVIAQVKQALGR